MSLVKHLKPPNWDVEIPSSTTLFVSTEAKIDVIIREVSALFDEASSAIWALFVYSQCKKKVKWECPLCPEGTSFGKTRSLLSLKLRTLRHLKTHHGDVHANFEAHLESEWTLLQREFGTSFDAFQTVPKYVKRAEAHRSSTNFITHLDNPRLVELFGSDTFCEICCDGVTSLDHLRKHDELENKLSFSEFFQCEEISIDEYPFPHPLLAYGSTCIMDQQQTTSACVPDGFTWHCRVPSCVNTQHTSFPTTVALKVHALRHFEEFHGGLFNEVLLDNEWSILHADAGLTDIDLRTQNTSNQLSLRPDLLNHGANCSRELTVDFRKYLHPVRRMYGDKNVYREEKKLWEQDKVDLDVSHLKSTVVEGVDIVEEQENMERKGRKNKRKTLGVLPETGDHFTKEDNERNGCEEKSGEGKDCVKKMDHKLDKQNSDEEPKVEKSIEERKKKVEGPVQGERKGKKRKEQNILRKTGKDNSKQPKKRTKDEENKKDDQKESYSVIGSVELKQHNNDMEPVVEETIEQGKKKDDEAVHRKKKGKNKTEQGSHSETEKDYSKKTEEKIEVEEKKENDQEESYSVRDNGELDAGDKEKISIDEETLIREAEKGRVTVLKVKKGRKRKEVYIEMKGEEFEDDVKKKKKKCNRDSINSEERMNDLCNVKVKKKEDYKRDTVPLLPILPVQSTDHPQDGEGEPEHQQEPMDLEATVDGDLESSAHGDRHAHVDDSVIIDVEQRSVGGDDDVVDENSSEVPPSPESPGDVVSSDFEGEADSRSHLFCSDSVSGKGSRKAKIASRKSLQIVEQLLRYKQEDVDLEYAKKAVRALVKRIDSKALECMLIVLKSRKSTTGCVTIQTYSDGRITVDGKLVHASVVSARVWRWPDATRDELQRTAGCDARLVDRKHVCINPFHYDRLLSKDRCFSIVSELLEFHKKGERIDYARKFIMFLVNKWRNNKVELDALMTAVKSRGASPTKCVTVRVHRHGQINVFGDWEFPHVIYLSIWRFPNVAKGDLRKLPCCTTSSGDLSIVCVNPWHYSRYSEDFDRIVEELQSHQKEGEDPFYVRKAIHFLVKRLENEELQLEALKTAITSEGETLTPCIAVEKGRCIAGRQIRPEVLYCRIWRWPDVSLKELQKLPSCTSDFAESICVNPFHYERVGSEKVTRKSTGSIEEKLETCRRILDNFVWKGPDPPACTSKQSVLMKAHESMKSCPICKSPFNLPPHSAEFEWERSVLAHFMVHHSTDKDVQVILNRKRWCLARMRQCSTEDISKLVLPFRLQNTGTLVCSSCTVEPPASFRHISNLNRHWESCARNGGNRLNRPGNQRKRTTNSVGKKKQTRKRNVGGEEEITDGEGKENSESNMNGETLRIREQLTSRKKGKRERSVWSDEEDSEESTEGECVDVKENEARRQQMSIAGSETSEEEDGETVENEDEEMIGDIRDSRNNEGNQEHEESEEKIDRGDSEKNEEEKTQNEIEKEPEKREDSKKMEVNKFTTERIAVEYDPEELEDDLFIPSGSSSPRDPNIRVLTIDSDSDDVYSDVEGYNDYISSGSSSPRDPNIRLLTIDSDSDEVYSDVEGYSGSECLSSSPIVPNYRPVAIDLDSNRVHANVEGGHDYAPNSRSRPMVIDSDSDEYIDVVGDSDDDRVNANYASLVVKEQGESVKVEETEKKHQKMEIDSPEPSRKRPRKDNSPILRTEKDRPVRDDGEGESEQKERTPSKDTSVCGPVYAPCSAVLVPDGLVVRKISNLDSWLARSVSRKVPPVPQPKLVKVEDTPRQVVKGPAVVVDQKNSEIRKPIDISYQSPQSDQQGTPCPLCSFRGSPIDTRLHYKREHVEKRECREEGVKSREEGVKRRRPESTDGQKKERRNS